MKRMLTLIALLAGGLMNELAHPAQCLLMKPAPVRIQRKKQ